MRIELVAGVFLGLLLAVIGWFAEYETVRFLALIGWLTVAMMTIRIDFLKDEIEEHHEIINSKLDNDAVKEINRALKTLAKDIESQIGKDNKEQKKHNQTTNNKNNRREHKPSIEDK